MVRTQVQQTTAINKHRHCLAVRKHLDCHIDIAPQVEVPDMNSVPGSAGNS